MRRTALYVALLLGGLVIYKLAVSPEWQTAIGSTAIALVRPIAIPVVDAINNPAFVYLSSLAIILAAIAASVAYWMRAILPARRRFSALRRAIRDLPSPREQKSATDAIRGLGEAVCNSGLFLSAWAGFQAETQRERRIPSTSFTVFAEGDPTVDQSGRRGLMQALPGYFTSVGLLLTFIGLVVALYFAARGFRSGSMEEARESILHLLNASSFKFMTSVAALFGALLVSMAFRFGHSQLRHEAELTIGLIESYIVLWRGRIPPSEDSQDPMVVLSERLDVLIAGIGALNGRIDALLGQPGAGLQPVTRDAAE
jgi:hypothetical protein